MKNPTGIKNIIFDLGGVLLNIDYQRTSNAFKELGYAAFDNMYSQYRADELFEKLETGAISNEDFYAVLQTAAASPVEKIKLTEAWNAMLLDFREGSLEYLKKLAGQYNLYLLSNTNSIHLEAVEQVFEKQFGKGSLDEYFTKAYYSNRIGRRKPNPDIYSFILEDAGITAATTLFIDDSYNNLEAAAAVGIHTYLLKPGEKIEDMRLI